MAFIWVAFAMLLSLNYCEAEPENCTHCKLVPVGEGLAFEFNLKASEKGVRLVYLNLKIGNESYHPLELQDEFLPARWVWANTINEPMLSLPEDFNILSLGLLNFQVRNMNVQLKDQPSGCLASLNSSCQNMAVGRMLLENVTTTEDTNQLPHKTDKTQVVCVVMIKANNLKPNETEYHCCGMQKLRYNGSFVRCDLTVASSSWLDTFNGIFYVLSVFMAVYIPALPLALPDCVFSLQYECDKEDRVKRADSGQAESRHTRNGYIQINQNEEEEDESLPVDDASPITFSTLLIGCIKRLPDIRLSFNIKLAIMWFGVYPCVLYAQLGLYGGYTPKEYINESLKKSAPFSYQFLFVNFGFGQIQFLAVVAFMGLIPVLFLRPKDLILDWRIPCAICKEFGGDIRGLVLPNESSNRYVGDEMCNHLKILHQTLNDLIESFAKLFVLVFKPFLCSQCPGLKMNRCIRPVCVLWSSICILPTLFVSFAWGAICLVLFLISSAGYIIVLSPLWSLTIFTGPIIIVTVMMHCTCFIRDRDSRPSRVLFLVFSCICAVPLLLLFFYNIFMLCVSCIFATSVVGFVIVGLVLNADIVTPYAAFCLVLTTNIYICYANLQKRYKKAKKKILKQERELHFNNNDPKKTISSKLFWFVCDRVLPFKTEFCLMLRNVVLIVAFLFLVVYSIVFFGNEYNVSAFFSTIAVFVSGVIPALVLKGLRKENTFIGWEKIRLEREIETAVREFYQGNSGESRVERDQWHRINNDDTLV